MRGPVIIERSTISQVQVSFKRREKRYEKWTEEGYGRRIRAWEGREKRHARTVTAVPGSPSQYVLFISAIYHVIPRAFSGRRRRRINLPKRFYSASLHRQQETDFYRVCPTARVRWYFLLPSPGFSFRSPETRISTNLPPRSFGNFHRIGEDGTMR